MSQLVTPLHTFNLPADVLAPWYVLPFDENGLYLGPRTRDEILRLTATGQFTDLFLFSHDWNDEWQVALDNYGAFIQGDTSFYPTRPGSNQIMRLAAYTVTSI